MFDPSQLFDITRLPAELADLLDCELAWEALARLDALGERIGNERLGSVHPTAVVEGPLTILEGAEVGPHAYLTGPVYLFPGAKVGHGAFLRGPVVLGPGAHVGHATEVKRSVFLGGAKAPHFNYVGDSVIGHDVNLGAGVKLANFKTFGSAISVGGASTGLRKLGSILGDGVSIGCNAVLAPGTVVGPRTIIYPGASAGGIVPGDSVVKYRSELEIAPRRA
jgi:bifunctional UDP-N-acetylglucosamine pyrophosphorylase/glucosamine-1-phosphate N-acetyltransferase